MTNMINTHGGARARAGRHTAEEIRKARSFKATEWEWMAIQETAEEESMSASEYIRSSCIRGKKPNYLDITSGEAVNIYEKPATAPPSGRRANDAKQRGRTRAHASDQLSSFGIQ